MARTDLYACGASGATAPANAQQRRLAALAWLRRVHGWLGLWGAVFGLLFGVSGIVLAHRAVLKLPVTKTQQTVLQYRLGAVPASAIDLARQLSRELGFDGRTPRVKIEPARPVAWNGVDAIQPERWDIQFDHPRRGARIEYFVGNGFARLEQIDATAVGIVTRLHMATGVDAFWVLLIDSFAGSLIALALTGALLWTRLRPPRMAGAAVLLGAPLLAGTWLALNP